MVNNSNIGLLFSTVSFIHSNIEHESNETHEEGVYCPRNVTPSVPGNSSVPDDDSSFDRIWDQYSTVPLFLIIIMFPLINLKSATFFTKFNALGKSFLCQAQNRSMDNKKSQRFINPMFASMNIALHIYFVYRHGVDHVYPDLCSLPVLGLGPQC